MSICRNVWEGKTSLSNYAKKRQCESHQMKIKSIEFFRNGLRKPLYYAKI